MKYQYIRAFIVLLAGLITLILNMKTGKSVTVSLAILLGVLIIFYFLATLIVEILQKIMEQEPSKPEEEGEEADAEQEEESEDEGNRSVSFDDDDE